MKFSYLSLIFISKRLSSKQDFSFYPTCFKQIDILYNYDNMIYQDLYSSSISCFGNKRGITYKYSSR